MAKEFRIATEPGPHVMKLQVAILDVQAAPPGLRTISTVVPQIHALHTAQSLATGQLLFAGGAEAEGKVTDSMTGTLLAEAVDRRIGGGAVDVATQWEWAAGGGSGASLDDTGRLIDWDLASGNWPHHSEEPRPCRRWEIDSLRSSWGPSG